MSTEKPHINLVVIGHVDSGKSTAADHLLYKCGRIDQQSIEKFETETKEENGKNGVFDNLPTERERCETTIDISHRKFESSKYQFTIIDTPGHRNYIENMITGISQADVAILVIDSSQYDGRYDDEAGDGGGICSSGNEDALLAYTFGVKQMIVVINKMDNDTVDFSEERYKTIRNDVSSFLKQVGYKPMKIPFIPISGLLGDNLISKSIHMLWYNGPSLLEALDNVNPPKRRLDKPLRIPIQDVYKIDEIRTVATGRVETGVLKPGMKVEFAPIGIIDTIETIEINNMTVSQAIPGDIVGFTVNNVMNGGNTDLLHLRRGYVTSNSDDQPAKGVSSFEAQVIIMNHPGEITNGYCPIIDCHTSHVSCVFANIKEKMDRRTGKCQEKNPKIVKTGDACIVELVPKKPLCVEPFTKFPTLGRFIVRDLQQIIAVGVVKSVTYGKVKECE